MFDINLARKGAKVINQDGCEVLIKRTDLPGEYKILGVTIINGSMDKSDLYDANGVCRGGDVLSVLEG